MLSALMEQNLIRLKRDRSRFKATDYEKDDEIFCGKCHRRKLAKIKLPNTGFGKSLDPEGKGYFMAVCECDCGLSKKEKEQRKSSEIEYFLRKQSRNEISEEEFTADEDLPFE